MKLIQVNDGISWETLCGLTKRPETPLEPSGRHQSNNNSKRHVGLSSESRAKHEAQ
jgi:hypothetical protein